MNFIKKLPIGLCFACVTALSSCSNEDVQIPAQPATDEIANANLRMGGNLVANPGFLNALPVISGTSGGSAGLNALPAFWNVTPGNPKPATYGVGISTFEYLWGDLSKPWQLTLSALPLNPSEKAVVTITSGETSMGAAVHRGSQVDTKIKNLVVGKKYEIKYWVATTKRGAGTTYAKLAAVKVSGNTGTSQNYTFAQVDFTNKKAKWIESKITFTATCSEMKFGIAGYNESAGLISYVHLFVGQNAISPLN